MTMHGKRALFIVGNGNIYRSIFINAEVCARDYLRGNRRPSLPPCVAFVHGPRGDPAWYNLRPPPM